MTTRGYDELSVIRLVMGYPAYPVDVIEDTSLAHALWLGELRSAHPAATFAELLEIVRAEADHELAMIEAERADIGRRRAALLRLP